MLQNRNRGRCRRFDTFRDAPRGSPSSRVSHIVLAPFHICSAPSKRSPHPSMRGGGSKTCMIRVNEQKITYIGGKTKQFVLYASQKWLKMNNITLKNCFSTFHGTGWPKKEVGIGAKVVVLVRDRSTRINVVDLNSGNIRAMPGQSQIFRLLIFR